jgi:predicted phosphodiesterase
MRIAIFSDVHGNLSGLEAVLADIERHRPDLIVVAGDLCMLGPRPVECVQLIRQRRLPTVVGNTDAWILDKGLRPDHLAEPLAWAYEQLSGDDRGWLGRLPFSLRVSPTARAADDLLIVHANPFDVNDILYPPEEMQRALYGEVRQSDETLVSLLDGVEAAVLAFGHLHVPNVRPLGWITLVNVSSINMPGDGDGRAKYALFDWERGQWTVAHHRVAFDVGAEIDAFRANRPPRWEKIVAALDETGYYDPHKS